MARKPQPTPPVQEPQDDPSEFDRPLDFATRETGPEAFAKATAGSTIGKPKGGASS